MSDAPVLPLELIVEILSWLPVKPLMRFRCVSKTWNFLVFDHKFIKLHLERSSKNGHILLRFGELFYDDDEQMMVGYGAALCSINRLLENPSSTIDDSLNQLDNTNFIGTCNGLVCFRRSDGWGLGMIEHQFQLWNPATRIMSECSSPLCNIYGDWFDPVNCGFGFDELSNTYKVVVLPHDTVSQTREVIVHSMGDTCWRKILTCPIFSMLGCYIGQLASGTVNWLALRISGFDYQWTIDAIDQLVIFSYDLKNETCRYLLMPEGFVEGRFSEEEPYFGVLKGCLCLAHDHTKTDLVVWLMREFGVEKSWTQLVKVNYDIVGFQTFKGMPLCMSQDEDVVLLVSLDSTTSDVVLYNRKHNRIEHSEYAYEKSSFICHDYFESLVLPY